MFLAMSGMFAMFFFNTLYIQQVLGYGPLEAGLAFLPFTAGIMVSAWLASQFAPRIGVRPVAAVGMLVAAAGMLLLTQLPVDGSYALNVLPALMLTSLGMGAVFMPLTLIATTGLEDEDQGLASGLFNTSQQIGGALGLADALDARREQDARGRRRARGRARGRLPLGVRGRSGPHPRRARRDGRPSAQAPRRADRGAGRLRRAGARRSLTTRRSAAPRESAGHGSSRMRKAPFPGPFQ